MGLTCGNNQVLDALRLPMLLFLRGLLQYRNLIELGSMPVQPFAPWVKSLRGVYRS